jgi:hypothetical protein
VQYDKHQEKIEGKKNSAFYETQIRAMKLIQETNPGIEFFATQRSDYNGYKLDDGNNFPPWIYSHDTREFNAEKHGRFLADFVIHMHHNGVPIRYLSSGKEITQILGAPEAVETIRFMNKRLDNSGAPRPLMVEPCAWSLPQAIEFIEQVEELGAQDLFHAYSTHNYRHHGETQWRKFVAAAERAGAVAWNGESGMGHLDNGIAEPPFGLNVNSMARRFRQYRAGIHGEIFFEIWSRGIGRETRPIYFQQGQRGQRMRAYYLMKHWTNTVQGCTVVDTAVSGPVTIDAIAFKRGSELILWVANCDSHSSAKIPIKIRNGQIQTDPIEYILWSSQTSIKGSEHTLDARVVEKFGVEIPPLGILAARILLK